MQPRKGHPVGMAGRDEGVGGDSRVIRGSLVARRPGRTGGARGPTGVRSAARAESTSGKGGNVRGAPRRSRPANARGISGRTVKSPGAWETGGWGPSQRGGSETTELRSEPIRLWRTEVSGAVGEAHSGLRFGLCTGAPSVG